MAAFKPNPINYIIGLDIGIASVGWAMVEIDCGVVLVLS